MPDLSPFLDPAKATAQAAVDAADRERDAALMAMDERRAQAERRAAGFESELAALKANPPHDIIPWVWGMKQEPGKTYGLSGHVVVTITAPNTRWVGVGTVWPGEVIGLNVRADDVTLSDLSFDYLPGSTTTDRLGIKPCVRTSGKRTRIINCDTLNVDTFAEIMPGADGALVAFCDAGPGLRASFVYSAGADDITVHACTTIDSTGEENVLRFSPQGSDFSYRATVTHCDLSNPGNKAALDCRHVAGVTVAYNTFRHNGGMAVRLGDSDLPGCSGLVFHENDIFSGFVHAKALSAGLLFNNRFHGLDAEKTYPLQFDPASKVDAFNNVGYVAALSGKERAWVGRDNKWEIK